MEIESYFNKTDNVLKRFFFIFGLTKDRFCEDNFADADLDRILHKHLADIGYRRIIYYSKSDKLYVYDGDSYKLTKRPDEESRAKPETTKKPSTGRWKGGPIPGKLKSAADAPEQTREPESTEIPARDNSGKIHLYEEEARKSTDESYAFQRINHCMHDKAKTKIKTAVIFTNADDFLKYFKKGGENMESHVSDSFIQYDGLTNDNIMLFVFPNNSSPSGAAAEYKDNFFEKKITKANSVIINPPASEEIRNTINRYRLMHGLNVDFTCLDAVCKRIAKELCKDRQSLLWLTKELDKIIDNQQVLNTERCDALFRKIDNETAVQKLGKLTGMENVKEEIRKLEDRKKSDEKPAANRKHHSRILPPVLKDDGTYNLHYVITGKPGTGKTTAAGLLGEIMYESGYLESGHTNKVTYKDLVSEYNPGDTAANTNREIEKAMGGVLFIDEAYQLAPSGEPDGSRWGQTAIDTILEAMSDREGQFSVVVAGYPGKMKAFIDSNPGLKRRFLKTIHIEDYAPEELLQIFYNNLQNNKMRKKYIASDTLSAKLGPFFENWHKSRDENWGNAGEVEKLLQEMDGNWTKRKGEKTAEGEIILDVGDIPEDLQRHCRPTQEAREDAMKKLNKLIGLRRVKERIATLQRRIKNKRVTVPGHYVFAGNPGTGKTTVARLLGDILREEGVLKCGHLVEVDREKLIPGHVGGTAPQTTKMLEEALDGIFFLDEAYQLDEGSGREHNYGREAIDKIVPFIWDHREHLCAIFAGYTEDMEKFKQINPGLTSRISETIIFDDYTTDEMVEILHSFAEGFVLMPEYIQKTRQIFDFWIENKDRSFGNARAVELYFADCIDALDERNEKEYEASDIPEEAKKTLTGRDIPSKYSSIVGGV